jgi:hypothetical protein
LTVVAASETLSFVLAMLGGSFRLLAKAVIPLAVLFILAGCGGSKQETGQGSVEVRGNGYTFDVPAGWTVERRPRGMTAHRASASLSVQRFPLTKEYDPAQFAVASKALDRIAKRLAADAKGETIEVDGRKARSYSYGSRRIGFVLVGKSEYQLFCAPAGNACDLLFKTFTLTGPSA